MLVSTESSRATSARSQVIAFSRALESRLRTETAKLQRKRKDMGQTWDRHGTETRLLLEKQIEKEEQNKLQFPKRCEKMGEDEKKGRT